MDHHVETTEFDSIGRHVNNCVLRAGYAARLWYKTNPMSSELRELLWKC